MNKVKVIKLLALAVFEFVFVGLTGLAAFMTDGSFTPMLVGLVVYFLAADWALFYLMAKVGFSQHPGYIVWAVTVLVRFLMIGLQFGWVFGLISSAVFFVALMVFVGYVAGIDPPLQSEKVGEKQ